MDPGHGYRMFCAECGTHLPNTAKFCLECGHRRESPAAETTTTAVSDQAPQVTADGRPIDPTRDVWGRSLAASDEAISEKSRTSISRTIAPSSDVERRTEREAADRRAAVQRLRNTGPIGSLNTPRSSPSVGPTTQTTISLTPGYLAVASPALVIIGSLGPWVSATLPFVGAFSVSGTDGDGKITLSCGIAAAVMLAFLVTSNQSGVWLGLLAGIALGIAALIGIVDWGNVGDEISASDQEFGGLVRVGWGLQVMTLSAIVGAVLALVQAVKATELT